jgi:hypothetical protein
MIHFRYAPFLTVSILHPYYADKVSSDFDFVPMPSTLAALDAYGLRVRNTSGSLALAQEQDATNHPVNPLDAVVNLFFIIRVKTDLLNITETFTPGKYWFSNLTTAGNYQLGLSASALLSAADQLPPIGPQRQSIAFDAGKYSAMVLQKIIAGKGWQTVQQIPVSATSNSIQTDVATPGVYQVGTLPLDNTPPVMTTRIFSDELAAAPPGWAVLHLQLKAGDANLNYTLTLNSRFSTWEYFLIEPKLRSGGSSITPINPNSLSMSYALPDQSRYPASVTLPLIDPGSYPQPVKDYVNSVTADPAIREVYFFQADKLIAMLDGPQPQLTIGYAGSDLVSKVLLPTRANTSTIIIYKL